MKTNKLREAAILGHWVITLKLVTTPKIELHNTAAVEYFMETSIARTVDRKTSMLNSCRQGPNYDTNVRACRAKIDSFLAPVPSHPKFTFRCSGFGILIS